MPKFSWFVLAIVFLSLPAQGAKVRFEAHFPKDTLSEVEKYFREATERAYTRLFADADVSRCISQNTTWGYVDNELVESHNGKEFLNAGKLFDEQIRVMRQHVNNEAELPPITFYQHFDEKIFAWAWAELGKAWTTADARKVYWHGGFEVTLNLAKVPEGNLDVWAGIIAHEMLHNLMHSHEDPKTVGIEKAYRKEVLINTAQNCVVNAKDLRNYASTNRCGGRRP